MPIEPGATYVFDLGYYDYAVCRGMSEGRGMRARELQIRFAVVKSSA